MTLRDDRVDFSTLATALSVGSIALLVIGLQPILLGELLDAHQVSLEGLGLVAMAEIICLGLGVLLGDLVLSLRYLRSATSLAALAAAGLDVATLQAHGDLGFAVYRGAAGLAEGILVWSTTAVIVRSSNPDRVAGIFFVTQTAAQAIAGLLLAHVILPARGWHGAFELLAGLLLLPVILAPKLPGTLRSLASLTSRDFEWTVANAVPLAVVFLQLCTLGALWAYVEPLGKDTGFSAPDVQTLIAICLGVQILGGSVGSALVRVLRTGATLLAGSVMLSAVALLVTLGKGTGTEIFAALCCVFAFLWLFITPFQMRFAFDADPTGRVASLIPAAQIFGIACGPLVASFFVQGEQAHAVPLVSAAFGVAAALIMCLRPAFRQKAIVQ